MKKMLSSITSLLDISGSYSEEKRRQRLFDIILGIFAISTTVMLVSTLFIALTGNATHPEEVQAVIFYCLLTILSLSILVILNHSKIGFLARLIFVAFLLLLAAITDTPAEVADGRSLLQFSLPIIAAGILFWPSASFIVAFISSAIVGGIAYFNNYQPLLSVIIFFLLATFTWLETSSLENQIKRMKDTNVAIKESEERYRALVEISPDMVILTDLSGEIIVVNQAGLSLFGFTDQEQAKGRKIFDFIAEEDRQRAITEFSQMAEIQSTVGVEYVAQTQQGKNFYLEINAAVLKDSRGVPQAVLSVGRDVTLRKKMELSLMAQKDESQEAYQALINNSAQGLVLLQNGRIILANKAIADSLGLTLDEIYALSENKIFEFVHPEDREIGLRHMQDRLMGKPVPEHYETRIVQKSGAIRWLELRPKVLSFNGINTSQITTIDITERKQAEEALRVSESKYRKLHESLRDGFAYVNMEGQILECNEAFQHMLGYSSEELAKLTYFDLTPENWHSLERKIVEEQILQRGYSDIYEKEYRRKDGRTFPVELRTFLIKNEAGKNEGMWATIRDITERKQASEALKEREKRYRDLFENASLAVFQSSVDGEVIAVNPEFVRMFGYQSPEEVKELVKDTSYFFADPQRQAEIIRLRKENPALNTFENVYRRKDGNTFIGQLSIKSIVGEAGQIQCFEGFIEDITLRKETEKALRESEERYRSLAEAAHDIIVIVTPDTHIEYVNQFAAQLVGMAPEQIIGLPHSQFFPSDTNVRHQGNLEKVFERGLPMFTESKTRFPKGEIWLSNWLVPLKDENGATKKILAISRDISNYKRIEAALRESEERYRNLAETAQDMIFIIGPDDRLQYANQFAAQVVNMAPEKVIGIPRSQLFPSSINDRQHGYIQQVFEKGQPAFAENFTPFPTGGRWLSTWLVPLKDASGKIKSVLGISRDISERKALEESLIEAKNSLEQRVLERTAALNKSREQLRQLTHETVLAQENERRRLSRELHDEAGQGLIGLTFSLDEILAEIPEEMKDIREKISRTLARIDKLNQRIRGMAHGLRPPILDVAGINLALQGFCHDFSVEAHFPVIYSGANDLPVIPEEISITLYRIVQEAITNVVKHSHATEAHVSLSHDGDCITLIVRDNGVGFDPMKTSKGVGLTGMEERLGLLGGRLEIASRRKHGTRLKAIVPIPRNFLIPKKI